MCVANMWKPIFVSGLWFSNEQVDRDKSDLIWVLDGLYSVGSTGFDCLLKLGCSREDEMKHNSYTMKQSACARAWDR